LQLTFMERRGFADFGIVALIQTWNQLIQSVEPTLQHMYHTHATRSCNAGHSLSYAIRSVFSRISSFGGVNSLEIEGATSIR